MHSGVNGWRHSVLLSAMLLVPLSLLRGASAQVPEDQRALYESVDAQLAEFEAHVAALSPAPGADPQFGLEVPAANSNRMPFLLAQSNAEELLLWLDAFAVMGCDVVKFDITYPVLTEDFHRYLRETEPPYPGYDHVAQYYVDFYEWAAGEARERGFGIVVEHSTLLPDFAYADATGYFDELKEGRTAGQISEAYKAARAAEALAIVEAVRPDYLTIVDEPSTMNDAFGPLPGDLPVLDLEGWGEYVAQARALIDSEAPGPTLLGAGVGTWESDESLAVFRDSPALDYVDLHMYPVAVPGQNLYVKMTAWSGDIQGAGKRTTVGETWVYKVMPSEHLGDVARQEFFSRDVYSFWGEIDRRYLTAAHRMAYANDLLFFCPFWSVYMMGYLDYETASEMTPSERLQTVFQLAADRLDPLEFSETGLHWQALITGDPEASAWVVY